MERRKNERSERWRESRNGDNGVRIKSMDVEWRERIWRGESRESGESEKMERERGEKQEERVEGIGTEEKGPGIRRNNQEGVTAWGEEEV